MNHYSNTVRGCLILLLSIGAQASQPENRTAQSGGETLRYSVRYQGLLSAFLPVEIASATLHLYSAADVVGEGRLQRASLRVTTEPFPRMESLYSLRFNYDSWFDPELRYTSVVEIRKQASGSRHELLWFDRSRAVVRRFRDEQRSDSAVADLPDFLRRVSRPQPTARFRERAPFKLAGTDVLDRLAMLYALRNRALVAGDIIELSVSNGKDLLGYSIAVEAREALQFDGLTLATLRLRFTPRFVSDGDRGYTVQAWLSDDERRLPIRFRSSVIGGAIELNMDRMTVPAG